MFKVHQDFQARDLCQEYFYLQVTAENHNQFIRIFTNFYLQVTTIIIISRTSTYMSNRKQSNIFILSQLDAQGLKCKECKFRCHTQCEAQVNLFAIVNIVAIIQHSLSSSVQVPPSCGLPAELLEIYWEHMKVNSSQNVSLNGISQKPFSQVVSHNGISQKCFSQRNLKGSRGKPESATSLAASRPDQSLRVELKFLQLFHPQLTPGGSSHICSLLPRSKR